MYLSSSVHSAFLHHLLNWLFISRSDTFEVCSLLLQVNNLYNIKYSVILRNRRSSAIKAHSHSSYMLSFCIYCFLSYSQYS